MPILGSSPAPLTEIISVAEASTHLRLNNVSSTQQTQLQVFCDAATAVVEFYRGEIVSRSYTEVYDGGDAAVYTRHHPVLTVDSVVENVGTIAYPLTSQPPGQSVDSYGYSLDDPQVGRIVRRGASGFAWTFRPGIGNVTVSYTVGATSVPAEAKLAALIIVAHLWSTQLGAGPRPPIPDDGEQSVPGTFYAIPNAAVQLLQVDGKDPVLA